MRKTKREHVREWLVRAGSDLKVARREMAATDPASDAVCFHFQQAVEKILKAWLLWQEVDFKPTHNIAALLAACEKIDPTFARLRVAEKLTPYAVDIRYADDFYFPTELEMRAAAEVAAQVESVVLEKLAADGLHHVPPKRQ